MSQQPQFKTKESEMHNLTFRRLWTVSEVNKTSASPIKDIEIKTNLPSYNYSQLTIFQNFLAPGTYKLTYTLRLDFEGKALFMERADYTFVDIIPVRFM